MTDDDLDNSIEVDFSLLHVLDSVEKMKEYLKKIQEQK
jgi:hypothetical protein